MSKKPTSEGFVGSQIVFEQGRDGPTLKNVPSVFDTLYETRPADDARIGIMDMFPLAFDPKAVIVPTQRIGRLLVSIPIRGDDRGIALVTSRLGHEHSEPVTVEIDRDMSYERVDWTAPVMQVVDYGAATNDSDLLQAHTDRLMAAGESRYRVIGGELGLAHLMTFQDSFSVALDPDHL